MRKISVLIICMMLAATTIQAQSCEDKKSRLLELTGSLSATLIYNTYLVIGSVGDGYQHEVYDSAQVEIIMKEQADMLTSNIKSLDELLTKKIFDDEDDKRFVTDINTIFKGLKEQANLLIDYVRKDSETIANQFQEKRLSNWQKIKILLGLE